MNINQVIKKLQAIKKEHGNIDVLVDQQSFKDELDNGEGFKYDHMGMKVEKMPMLNPDTYKPSRKKYPTVVIYSEYLDL